LRVNPVNRWYNNIGMCKVAKEKTDTLYNDDLSLKNLHLFEF